MDFENGFPIGIVSKTHGYKGSLRIGFYEESFSDQIKKEGFLFIEIDKKGVPFYIVSLEQNGTVVQLEDVDTEEKAKKLIGKTIVSFDKSLKKEQFSFENYTLRSDDGIEVGTILEVQNHNGNMVLMVRSTKGEIMVPIHEDLLRGIDDNNKVISMIIPDGLLDL